MLELHREGCPSLAHVPELGGVSEHPCQRDESLEDLCVALPAHGGDASALLVDRSRHRARVFLRRDDHDAHDGLEQLRIALHECALEAFGCAPAEGHVGRIHLVRGAVEQDHLHVHHRVVRHDTALHGFDHALLNRTDELPGDPPAGDPALELEAMPGRHWLQPHDDMSELAVAAGLLDEPLVDLH